MVTKRVMSDALLQFYYAQIPSILPYGVMFKETAAYTIIKSLYCKIELLD